MHPQTHALAVQPIEHLSQAGFRRQQRQRHCLVRDSLSDGRKLNILLRRKQKTQCLIRRGHLHILHLIVSHRRQSEFGQQSVVITDIGGTGIHKHAVAIKDKAGKAFRKDLLEQERQRIVHARPLVSRITVRSASSQGRSGSGSFRPISCQEAASPF